MRGVGVTQKMTAIMGGPCDKIGKLRGVMGFLNGASQIPTRNINRGILPQQASQICMYTSFFKRERQYDPFKAKEIIKVLR